MKVLTKQEVLKRIENFCKPYVSYAAAAKPSAARLRSCPMPVTTALRRARRS